MRKYYKSDMLDVDIAAAMRYNRRNYKLKGYEKYE